jgi:hypothetical protein
MPAPRKSWRRLSPWVINPVVTAVLAVLLLLDLGRLPGNAPWSYSTAVHYSGRLGPGTMWVPPLPSGGHVIILRTVNSENGWEVADPEWESWDVLSRKLQTGVGVQVSLFCSVDRSGLWAHTKERREARVEVRSLPNQSEWPAADRMHARHLAVDRFLDERFHAERIALIRSARDRDVLHTRTLWGGVLHNTLVGIALAWFLVSLAWIPMTPGWARRQIRSARIRRQHCARCNYDLRGLGAEAGHCPECGERLPTTTSDTRVEDPNSTRL